MQLHMNLQIKILRLQRIGSMTSSSALKQSLKTTPLYNTCNQTVVDPVQPVQTNWLLILENNLRFSAD